MSPTIYESSYDIKLRVVARNLGGWGDLYDYLADNGLLPASSL